MIERTIRVIQVGALWAAVRCRSDRTTYRQLAISPIRRVAEIAAQYHLRLALKVGQA
jgi:hypothetical protein